MYRKEITGFTRHTILRKKAHYPKELLFFKWIDKIMPKESKNELFFKTVDYFFLSQSI